MTALAAALSAVAATVRQPGQHVTFTAACPCGLPAEWTATPISHKPTPLGPVYTEVAYDVACRCGGAG